jgi:hypothetical protein
MSDPGEPKSLKSTGRERRFSPQVADPYLAGLRGLAIPPQPRRSVASQKETKSLTLSSVFARSGAIFQMPLRSPVILDL